MMGFIVSIFSRWRFKPGQIVSVAGENGRRVPGRISRQYLRKVGFLAFRRQYGVRYCPHGSQLYRIGVLDETEIQESKAK